MGYVPLDKRAYFVPEVLDGMEQLALVCIDNIECIAGDEEWRWRSSTSTTASETGRTRLFITGDRPPRQLNLRLPDLASRPDWGRSTLQPLSDEENCWRCSCAANCAASSCRKTGRFLLKRLDREMRTLFMTSISLDRASITAQRKLTIPFVKEIPPAATAKKGRDCARNSNLQNLQHLLRRPADTRLAAFSPRSGVLISFCSPSSLPAAVRSGCRPPASIPLYRSFCASDRARM